MNHFGGLLFTAVFNTNAASPSLGDAAIYVFHRRVNLVGYANKAATENLNYYAPQFTSVGNNTVNIQDITLKDEAGMVGYGDIMQLADPLGSPMENYAYWGKFADPTGTVDKDFYWANEDYTPAIKSFNPGEGFAIDNANSMDYDITIKCPYSL